MTFIKGVLVFFLIIISLCFSKKKPKRRQIISKRFLLKKFLNPLLMNPITSKMMKLKYNQS